MGNVPAIPGSFSKRFRIKYRYSKPIVYTYFIVFLSFPVVKGILRPWAISTIPDSFFTTVLFSYPNFAEAVIGLSSVSVMLFIFRNWCRERFNIYLIQDTSLYLISASLSAVFVITQEMKIHDLGGENIYDINDIYASCIGLIFTLGLLLKFGVFSKRKVKKEISSL
ncbi:MAG: hypothetical protein JJ971_13795 [Balneolaceae bacterium]|nr:hypothetical protein [Balneolaceae bacterium]MBO6547070.1 hypothetical protein [Balneolaceae bacterium]MBO6647983.1 hypothetical protein [Balneolaceae bacterium]